MRLRCVEWLLLREAGSLLLGGRLTWFDTVTDRAEDCLYRARRDDTYDWGDVVIVLEFWMLSVERRCIICVRTDCTSKCT